MKIKTFTISPEDVARGLQHGETFLKVSNACPCGCSPNPFVSISDGKIGITVGFETEGELKGFKALVEELVW